jgi:hypothetical protein
MKNTNPQTFYYVLCGLITLVVMINIWLFSALRHKKGETRPWDMFRNATRKAKNPWQDEDDQLKELSSLVANLKNETPSPSDEEKPAGDE